jgi:hypothetical protein
MRRSLIVAFVLVLSATATALGQRGTGSYVTAIGPDSHGARLQVRARPGGACVQVLRDDDQVRRNVCAVLPRIDLTTPFVLDVASTGASGETSIGGAVRSGVARVEYLLADGQRFGADTVAAPQLGGRLARALRYFLLELPRGADPVTRRLLDASGRVVDEQDDLFELGSVAAPRPLKGPVRLAGGRRDGARWSVYAAVRNQLEPVRGDAGRWVPSICTGLSRTEASSCDDVSRPTFGASIEPGCPPDRASVLHGIAGPGVRVEVRLGDRRLHPVRMLALPDGFAPAGTRAWVFPVPFEVAVQSVRATAADGRLLFAVPLRQAPPQVDCAGGDFSVGIAELVGTGTEPVFTGPPAVIQPGGGPPLTVRDAGAELCVSVGPARDARTCLAPPPWVILPVVAAPRVPRVAGGAVDPAIAAVLATASDGSTQRVATDPGSAYTGRYAGLVRFFTWRRRRERIWSPWRCSTRAAGG